MNSQIMENVIQYYLHVHDSALRIYSQNKSEYRTANYLYCGQKQLLFSFSHYWEYANMETEMFCLSLSVECHTSKDL